MMIYNKRSISYICMILFSVYNLYSQTSYSPYSMLGLGELETRDYGRTSGMGGVGTGMRDYDLLNTVNPSGLTALDSLKFVFDISATAKQSYFASGSKKENTFNANFRRLAFGFKVSHRWAMAVGTKPFSNVGYQIESNVDIEGSTETKSVYIEGAGGLYSIYWSNAFLINKYLSVGINSMYIAGNIKQTENQTDYLFEKSSRTSQLYNTFGLQFHNGPWVAGLTYGYKQGLTMDNSTVIYNSSSTELDSEDSRSTSQFIPETFSAGLSWSKKNIVLAMDYEYQKLKGLSSGTSGIKITDYHRLKAGMSYTPDKDIHHYRLQSQYQFGVSLSKSYLQVKENDIYNYTVSAGYSWPLKGAGLLNMSLEYGNSLSAPKGYIRESYVGVTVGFSMFETWFKRNKFR